MVISFALVAHRSDRHGFVVLDFEQNDITRRTERDKQLAQKGVAPFIVCLAAGERKKLEKVDGFVNGGFSACGGSDILFQQKIKQAQQFIFCFQSEADVITHFAACLLRAFFNLALSLLSTFLAEIYSPLSLAASREAKPRAMNSCCVRRNSTLRRSESSTNADSVSPGRNISSAACRNSGCTRRAGMVAVFMGCLVHCKCNAYPRRNWREVPGSSGSGAVGRNNLRALQRMSKFEITPGAITIAPYAGCMGAIKHTMHFMPQQQRCMECILLKFVSPMSRRPPTSHVEVFDAFHPGFFHHLLQ